jgi:putative transposase
MLRELGPLVTPDTLLRWYRELIARKYDGSVTRARSDAPTREHLRGLVVRLAAENDGWGYTRILGALKLLGHQVSRTTVRRILEEAGMVPAPKRGMTWETFLGAHWHGLFATDFFHVEVLTLFGLVRYQVLFVIKLSTREVEMAGVVKDAYGAWTQNMFRGLTFDDSFLSSATHLIMDRDPVFNRALRDLLADRGIQAVRLPARSPNLNAYAERFIGSVRRECLSKVIPLGVPHLRWLLREYTAHYNQERPHQGIGNRLIQAGAIAANGAPGASSIQCHERAGGLLRFYERRAA